MSTCLKKSYATAGEARRALHAIRRAAGESERRREQGFYRCGCGSWHLTSRPANGFVRAG